MANISCPVVRGRITGALLVQSFQGLQSDFRQWAGLGLSCL